MSATSSIEWTDRTWNPVRGCSVISPGCVNCYAMKQAHRFSGPGKPYEGLTKLTAAGPQWTGAIRTVESALLEPLSWRKPARVFVNSMSDLFHEDVPDAFIDKVFAVMALAPSHTFQVLTKRTERMRDYVLTLTGSVERMDDIDLIISDMAHDEIHATAELMAAADANLQAWPLRNVWLGTSVENQPFADKRIPPLLQTPAAVRFISAEPLLGPIDLTGGEDLRRTWLRTGAAAVRGVLTNGWLPPLDWVIVGGESGPGARPFDIQWARDILAQCRAAGVACFIKQLGANPWASGITPMAKIAGWDSRKGNDPSEWPEDLRVREFPKVAA